ncbi:hypothetical protein ACVWWO_004516 [Bradyrhizobium sp. F1.13.1]
MDARTSNATEIDSRPTNNLLRRLSPADFALLAPHVMLESAAANELLYNPGDDVQVVHFPCGPSLATFLVPNEDGRDVETILVGREGAVGGIVSEGFLPAYTRICVKFGGPFARIHVGKLEAAKQRSPSLRHVFARYADCMLAQIFQSTACNAIHSIEQRTAKWMLAAMERTGDESSVPLTHEQLATLLGVGRSYASRGASVVQGGRRARHATRIDPGPQPRGPAPARLHVQRGREVALRRGAARGLSDRRAASRLATCLAPLRG